MPLLLPKFGEKMKLMSPSKVGDWITAAGVVFSSILVSYMVYYRRSIRKRLSFIEDELSRGLMIREDASKTKNRKEIRCLELNPEFVAQHKQKWRLVSLGQYLTSLRPSLPGSPSVSESDDENEDGKDGDTSGRLPAFIERELEVTIGTVLLRTLGRRIGGAILPLLGFTDIQSTTSRLAGSIASWWVSHFVVKQTMETLGDPMNVVDAGCFPVNLNEVISLANLNQKLVPSTMKIKALEWMRRGEIGYDPSFGTPIQQQQQQDDEDQDKHEIFNYHELIPNPFIVSIHWNSAIEGMEKLIVSKNTVQARETPNAETKVSAGEDYNPDDRSFPDPVPVNERLLPDLHLGWGNAKCTHTKREIIRNRLFTVLLNKLSYNFYKKEQKDSDLFVLKMTESSKESIYYPHDFVKALLDTGHSVEMCPKSHATSFGVAICIKERDGGWSNVPLGLFFRSGYERADGRPSYYLMPHGGMNLGLKGPLVGQDENGEDCRCDIQFYMAIDGMCGWHSNHNADVPWLQTISSTDVYNQQQSILAVKLAGILAVAFNAIGTEMDLPYGGYGVLGCCNDTAALLDYGVRGRTNMFPLISTGRFLIGIGRRLIRLFQNIHYLEGNTSELEHDIRRLITACCQIPSDLLASPANLISSSSRFLASQPESLCFLLEKESKIIMTDLKDRFDQFDEQINSIFGKV